MTTDIIPLNDAEKAPATRRVLEFLCGTLTVAVLEALADAPGGARRYNGLHRLFPQTPKRTLTGALRRLERVGVVERRVFAEVPTRVEYRLTPLGQAWMEPIRQLGEWAQAHPDELDAVLAARSKNEPCFSRCSH